MRRGAELGSQGGKPLPHHLLPSPPVPQAASALPALPVCPHQPTAHPDHLIHKTGVCLAVGTRGTEDRSTQVPVLDGLLSLSALTMTKLSWKGMLLLPLPLPLDHSVGQQRARHSSSLACACDMHIQHVSIVATRCICVRVCEPCVGIRVCACAGDVFAPVWLMRTCCARAHGRVCVSASGY